MTEHWCARTWSVSTYVSIQSTDIVRKYVVDRQHTHTASTQTIAIHNNIKNNKHPSNIKKNTHTHTKEQK